MSKFEYWYTFDDGVKAGNRLLELICEIDPKLHPACEQFIPEDKLSEIYTALWNLSESKRPLRCIEGFLSRVLKPNGLDGQIITFWGADELLANQGKYAPICEIPRDSGIVQLGYWTGESDGDGWCLDINWEKVRCVCVSAGSPNLDDVRLSSYGVFSSLWQWVAYLRCSAWERGWIKQP